MAVDNTITATSFSDRVAAQFKNLEPGQPWSWPFIPQLAIFITTALAVAALGWFLVVSGAREKLEQEVSQEVTLKETYKDKYKQAVNLDGLREQRAQVQQYVLQLEKQLPSKAEMDALLSDINQAGLGRGLQFQLFKPGNETVKEYYAELPIEVKVAGRYHDIGAFAADVASLSRIVTLNNMNITPDKEGNLVMATTAKTFRYLDPEEVAATKKAAAKSKKSK